ncbi:MAG: cation:proton antiporter [Chitinophagales bacterium]
MFSRNLKRYLIIILPLLAAIGVLMYFGESLKPSAILAEVKNVHAGEGGFAERLKHPLAELLTQMLVILLTAKLVGYLFKLIGQQEVMGEIAAGIVLGPSLLGWLWPVASAFLFPAESLKNLQMLSQIGLVLFMFVIGMELDIEIVKRRASEALLVSHASIFFPFLLGVGLAVYLYPRFAPSSITFTAYSLFMGIALSITAFPVLARILKERRMARTQVGNMALICAALNDVTGWCLLALVIGIAKATATGDALLTIAIALVYGLVMFYVARPIVKRLSERYFRDLQLSPVFVAIILLTLVASSLIAEVIGIHALFGAFLAGVIMPPQVAIRKLFTDRIEDVSAMLLLPLFFAFTGLRTQIGLVNSSYLWMLCGVICFLAIFGKVVGSAVTARWVGQSWRDSLMIGALMNTRGLMELIVLNIGYELGILTPEIFTMLVFMALATTMMTAPALNLIEKFWPKKTSEN